MFSPNPLEPPQCDDGLSSDSAPQFGALEIVEAFTAMRHEWRGQTKESRALAEQIEAAAANIQSLEPKLLARLAEARTAQSNADGTTDAAPLALLLIETDSQLSRAVTAVEQWETSRRLRAESDQQAIALYFASMNRLARWLARPLMTFVSQQRAVPEAAEGDPAIEGLHLVLARFRQAMQDHRIERLDVLGQAFDAETMHAIGTVATTDYPSGHVAEQFTAAYRWQGRLLRFADVRIAE